MTLLTSGVPRCLERARRAFFCQPICRVIFASRTSIFAGGYRPLLLLRTGSCNPTTPASQDSHPARNRQPEIQPRKNRGRHTPRRPRHAPEATEALDTPKASQTRLKHAAASAPDTPSPQALRRRSRGTPETRPRHAPDTHQTRDRGSVGDGLWPISRRLGAWRAPAGPGAFRKYPQTPDRARFATRPSHTVRRFCTPRTPDCGNAGARPPGYLRPRLVPPGPSPSSGPPGYPRLRGRAHHQSRQDTLAPASSRRAKPSSGRPGYPRPGP